MKPVTGMAPSKQSQQSLQSQKAQQIQSFDSSYNGLISKASTPPSEGFDRLPFDLNSRTPTKQQSLKRIPLMLNRGSAAVAAEELNLSVMDLVGSSKSHQATSSSQKPSLKNIRNAKRSEERPTSTTRAAPLCIGEDIAERVSKRGSTQSSIHRPSSYLNNESGSNYVAEPLDIVKVAPHTTYPMYEDAEEDEGIAAVDVDRIPCPICQRKFAGEERLV
ncbi:hypothetical protein BDR26DRAFT_581054 [Obelidium mucronatum]|nr:hypothetical protein BDR26DRAFT_581054 [Obelidium mucronatum]